MNHAKSDAQKLFVLIKLKYGRVITILVEIILERDLIKIAMLAQIIELFVLQNKTISSLKK